MNRILLINNDYDTMDLMKQWLERKNFIVKYTGKREEVKNLFSDFKPDLFIIDSQQSEIADALRQQAEAAQIPVLMMTGYSARYNISLPGNDVIEKPLNLQLLEKKIHMLIAS